MQYLRTLKTTLGLSKDQESVFDAKYAMPPVGFLCPADFVKSVKILVFKISVITGWNLPEQQEVLNILYDQMGKKLMEDYSDLNTDEIEYAFRSFGTTVKDWGKNVNLSLIDEVLLPYKSKRLEVSQIEERKAKKQNELPASEPITNGDELVETVRAVFLKTKLTGLIPSKVYDILVEKEELNLDNTQKEAIRARIIAKLNQDAIAGGEIEIRALKMMNKRDYEIKVRNECKKQAVANYFLLQNEIDNC